MPDHNLGIEGVRMRDTLAAADSMQDASVSTDRSLSKMTKTGASTQLDTSAFNALKCDVQDMLREVAEDKSLDRFRLEFEKLFRALKRSHDHEKRLIRKLEDLNLKTANSATKEQAAIKLSQEHEGTIIGLRTSVEEASERLIASEKREEELRRDITKLENDITDYNDRIRKDKELSADRESLVKELTKVQDEMTRKTLEQAKRICILESQLKGYADTHSKEIESRKEIQNQLQEALRATSQREANLHREYERKEEERKREMDAAISKFELKSSEVNKRLALEVSKLKNEISTKATVLEEVKKEVEQYANDCGKLITSRQSAVVDLEAQIKVNKTLECEKNATEKDKKALEYDADRLNNELSRLHHELEDERGTTKNYKILISECECSLELEKEKSSSLQMQLDEIQSAMEIRQRNNVEVRVEEKGQNLHMTAGTTAAQEATYEANQNIEELRKSRELVESIGSQLSSTKAELVMKSKEISRLENEMHSLSSSLSEAQNNYAEVFESSENEKLSSNKLHKRIQDLKEKVRQQQKLVENTRIENDRLLKDHNKADGKITKMNHKLSAMNEHVELLKEEIAAKDCTIMLEQSERKRIEKLGQRKQAELDCNKKLVQTKDSVMSKQDGEVSGLSQTIQKMENELAHRCRAHDQVIYERDLLGTQLIRRNDELALLHEKVRIQQYAINNGTVAYNQRLDDMRILRIKCQELARDLQVMRHNKSIGVVDREKFILLQNKLIKERVKVKALSDELENPLNVHRWRKLEGSDPAAHEMIRKVQLLQKRLVTISGVAEKKELLLKKKEEMCRELKALLDKQPGPEVAEQLSKYKSSLRKKENQMKSIIAELNMCNEKLDEQRRQAKRIAQDHQESKQYQLLQEKRKQRFQQQQMPWNMQETRDGRSIPAIEQW